MTNHDYVFLFDLDGTLVITDEIYQNVWRTIMLEYNVVITPEIFKTYIQGNNDQNVLIQLLPNNYRELLPTISTLKDKYFLENLDKIQIVYGAIDFLKEIKHQHGYKIAIVTNCNTTVAQCIISHINIHTMIDALVTSQNIRPKPHPDPYLKAIKLLESTHDRAIIFEDSKVGIQSGKNTFPKCLIGVETIYDSQEMKNLDTNFSIKNYKDLNINTILNYNNINISQIKSYIHNSFREPTESIDILNYKLKGGFISDVIGVKIRLKGSEKAELSLDCVLKMENKKESFLSKMANDLKLYDREYYFYEHLYNYVNVNVPRFYGVIKDNQFNNVGILMENLVNPSFKLNLDLNEEKIDVSLRVIERLAQLHAKFWNKNLSTQFKELKKHSDPCFQPHLANFVADRWETFQSKWKNILPPSKIEKAQSIVNNFTKIQEALSVNNLTLIHGDVKSANIFYKCEMDDANKITSYEPYFIDWQYICEGKGVQDLVFFMIESFNIDTINKYHNIFRDYYYIKLCENGVEYALEDYNQDFEHAISYFPFFVAMWFGTTSEDELIDPNFPFFFIQRLFNFL